MNLFEVFTVIGHRVQDFPRCFVEFGHWCLLYFQVGRKCGAANTFPSGRRIVWRTISSPVTLCRSNSCTLLPPRFRMFVEGFASPLTTSHSLWSLSYQRKR